MDQGCFVWTLTPPLSGRKTPCPGSPRDCVCVPLLAGSASWPPRRVLVRLTFSCGLAQCALCLLLPWGLGLPCLWLLLCSFFFSLLSFNVPPFSLAFRVLWPGLPWAFALLVPPPLAHPPPFFFATLSPPCLFFFPSLLFHTFLFCCVFPLFFLRFLCGFLLLLCIAGCAVRGRSVCPGPWGVLVCVALVVVPRQGLVCAYSVSSGVPWLHLFSLCCCLSYCVSPVAPC